MNATSCDVMYVAVKSYAMNVCNEVSAHDMLCCVVYVCMSEMCVYVCFVMHACHVMYVR